MSGGAALERGRPPRFVRISRDFCGAHATCLGASLVARRLLLLLLGACSSSGGSDPPVVEAELVVGVQADDAISTLLTTAHVVTKMDGVTLDDRTVPATSLPLEIPVKGKPGALVEVSVDAKPITRVESTALVSGEKRLLRVMLDGQCLNAPCPPLAVPPDRLEDYEAGWAAAPPDICRPARHGAPELQMGSGMTDFRALNDGDELAMELGPQGGHHIWIAARMKNLRRSGSISTITAKLTDDPSSPVPPAAYVFTFDPDEGHFCKLAGLRFQLDADATDLATAYERFLGKQLEVTLTVTDSTKASVSATRTIQIGEKLVCPDGTDSCNAP